MVADWSRLPGLRSEAGAEMRTGGDGGLAWLRHQRMKHWPIYINLPCWSMLIHFVWFCTLMAVYCVFYGSLGGPKADFWVIPGETSQPFRRSSYWPVRMLWCMRSLPEAFGRLWTAKRMSSIWLQGQQKHGFWPYALQAWQLVRTFPRCMLWMPMRELSKVEKNIVVLRHVFRIPSGDLQELQVHLRLWQGS